MYFPTCTIIAFAGLLASGSAAPTAESVHPGSTFSNKLAKLDAKGHINWTEVEGGRVAKVPFKLIDGVDDTDPKNHTLQARDGPKADVGGWTNAGLIASLGSQYACEQSGEWAQSTTIASLITPACSQLLSMVPGAPVAEKFWNVYTSATEPDGSGNQFNALFRFFYNTPQAPKLTETICTQVFQDLTSAYCQGTGGQSDKTRGGEIQVGTGDDYVMVGLDPNSA